MGLGGSGSMLAGPQLLDFTLEVGRYLESLQNNMCNKAFIVKSRTKLKVT